MNQDTNQFNQNDSNIQNSSGINNQSLNNQEIPNQQQINNNLNYVPVEPGGYVQQPVMTMPTPNNDTLVNNSFNNEPNMIAASPNIQPTVTASSIAPIITAPVIEQNIIPTNPNMQQNITAQTINEIGIPELQINQAINQNMIPDNQTTTVQSNNSQSNYQMPQQNATYTNPQTTNSQDNNEELLKAFIGKNYEKITTKKFNFAGFFFSSLYMYYRKMFIYGLTVFIINLLTINFLDSSISTIVNIMFLIILGMFTNKIYIKQAKKKIEKIKLQNSSKDINKIKNICIKKGGASIGKTCLGFFIEIIVLIIASIIMTIAGIPSALEDYINVLNKNSNTNNSNIKDNNSNNNSTYNGIIMYNTSVNISDEFSMSVPNVFENNSNEYEYKYEYSSGQGVFDSCSVSLNVVEGYSSANNLIKQMAAYYSSDVQEKVSTEKLNDINWNYFSYNSAFGTTYYYGTTKNNKVYLLEYSIEEDASVDCESYRQIILKSVKK